MLSTNQIYVADIKEEVDEGFLHWLFEECGEIISINLEKYNNLPKKHALITFRTHEAAEKAINDLNYSKIDGIPIRIIWGDPETKRILESGRGCILICGLDKSIEVSQIHESFSEFGEIISCFIPMKYSNGGYISCGFAYVQYRHPADAEYVKQDLDGATINGNEVKIINCTKHYLM